LLQSVEMVFACNDCGTQKLGLILFRMTALITETVEGFYQFIINKGCNNFSKATDVVVG